MPWSHRSLSLMGIKLLAAVLSTFFLWSRPTTLPWVVKVSRPEAAAPAAPAAAAAGTAPPWPSSAPQRQTQQRVLQACVRNGGFYDGEWVHRPHTWRPHAHYARGLAGKHKFFDAELAFRKAHPLNAAADAAASNADATHLYLPHVQHDWEPHAPECRLSPFNRTRACLALGEAAGLSRRVLFVGDSMSFAHALSLLFMLGGPQDDGGAAPGRKWVPKQTEWTEKPVCGDVLGGAENAVLVHFIRNDALYVAPQKLEDGWATRPDLRAVACGGVDFASSRPWTPYFERELPGLVVLNLGTHIHKEAYFRALLDDASLYLQRHRAAWRQEQEQEQEQAHRSNGSSNSSKPTTYPRLLFRNTGPGHPECWRYRAPASEQEARVLTQYQGEYRDKFTWHLIPSFNRYLERRLGEVFASQDGEEDEGGQDGVLLLRAEGITRGRPDGHLVGELKDCLHYHMPGPVDAWTLTLLESLYALHGV